MSSNEILEGKKELKVAVVGCSHGELDIIYDTLRRRESDFKTKIDVLLCCGDFQAMRNEADLVHFHCPEKYKRLGDFYKYYSGEKEAPCLTIFIGGNHESSAFSMELPHGGWVAKNIYYMGFASVVNFGGLRIGGWSGIFKPGDYLYTHHETLPFNSGQQVSAYHVRSVEKFRLSLLADNKPNCIDLFMTHDWPVGITSYGNERQLIKFKPHFREDIEKNQLGNPHSRKLVHEIRPYYWFAGHLHCKFEATVPHEKDDDCEAEGVTNFLALHKCDHNRINHNFFDIRTIKVKSPLSNELRYDPKWLAILRKTTELEVAQKGLSQIPSETLDYMPTDEDLKKVDELFGGDYVIPLNFRRTATPQQAYTKDPNFFGAHYYRNPQTKELCERLEIPDLNEDLCRMNMAVVGDPYYLNEGQSTETKTRDEGEISLDNVDIFGDDDFVVDTKPAVVSRKRSADVSVDKERDVGDDKKKARLDDEFVIDTKPAAKSRKRPANDSVEKEHDASGDNKEARSDDASSDNKKARLDDASGDSKKALSDDANGDNKKALSDDANNDNKESRSDDANKESRSDDANSDKKEARPDDANSDNKEARSDDANSDNKEARLDN